MERLFERTHILRDRSMKKLLVDYIPPASRRRFVNEGEVIITIFDGKKGTGMKFKMGEILEMTEYLKMAFQREYDERMEFDEREKKMPHCQKKLADFN